MPNACWESSTGFRGFSTCGVLGVPSRQVDRFGQMSRGLTMVKPESLLLSSSGLELGLLEEAEAGPISGSENTRGE